MSQPTPGELHIDGYGERKRKKRKGKVTKSEASRRERLGGEGKAFKNPDGHYSFPTESKDEIQKAIHAIGRAPADLRSRIQAYIKRRAAAEGVGVPDGWGATAKSDTFAEVTELWKDESQQIVYGVALAPDREDSQEDTVSCEEIEKAAHRFLVHKRQTDVQHAEQQVPVDVIESYIAPHDIVVAGKPVTKGSWVMAHKVNDRKLWKRIVKGEITGLSIGGSAIRAER